MATGVAELLKIVRKSQGHFIVEDLGRFSRRTFWIEHHLPGNEGQTLREKQEKQQTRLSKRQGEAYLLAVESHRLSYQELPGSFCL
jgi:hypothetical protein